MTTPITVQSAGFSSAPQIDHDDLPAIAAAGYRAIVCNRPDGEGGIDQPASDALAAAARRHGLAFAYLPVVPGQISDAQVDAFAELLRTLPGPVLGYCRSGVRATTLHQRSQART